MVGVALMIEGQNGLNWLRWQRIVSAAEDLGFAGLFRSDHYTNSNPPDLDSLELWVSLTWLASHTRRIEFGPLVSPISFRHPTMTARMAAAVDDLSEGRLVLGLGAGWQEREHHNYGWDLLSVKERFARFEEGVQVISRLLRSDAPFDFEGRYYQLHEAILLPRPCRRNGPPILIGGNGYRRTLPLAARYSDEWNAIYTPLDEFRKLNAELNRLLLSEGRAPANVCRSIMTGCVFGRNRSEVGRKVEARTDGRRSPQDLRQRGLIVGEAAQIREQLAALAEVGVQRVMLQWLNLDDLQGIERMAQGVIN
jgi:F420-dependent oxidoreductase-like protein